MYSAFKPLHLHTYCTLLRSQSRQYMQGWCARLLFPLAMATNRETINNHISPPYLKIWWYKTSKLLLIVLLPYLSRTLFFPKAQMQTQPCQHWLGYWLLFLCLSNDPLVFQMMLQPMKLVSPSSLLIFLSKHGLKKDEPLGANWGRKECSRIFPTVTVCTSTATPCNLLPSVVMWSPHSSLWIHSFKDKIKD